MNATPPPLPTTAKPQNTFFHHAATYSVLAPFISVGVTILTFVARAGSPAPATRAEVLVSGLLSTFIILSGFVFGIVALFGIKRYGTAGILWKAVVGILIFVFLILSAIPPFFHAREKARERYEQMYGHPPP